MAPPIARKDADQSSQGLTLEPLRKRKTTGGPIAFNELAALVTFIVGAEGKTMLAHKEVVCRHSPVLYATFNSELIEGQIQTYMLDCTIARAFKLFMQYVYSGSLHLVQLGDDFNIDTRENEADEDDQALVELWVLAEMLGMPKLQNFTTLSIQKISMRDRSVASHTIDYIYKDTAEDSLLRAYFVARIVLFSASGAIKRSEENFRREFLIDSLEYVISLRINGRFAAWDLKDFLVSGL